MRYLPKSPAERQEMLSAIGAESMDDLFSSIPERYRLREALKLPGPFSEIVNRQEGMVCARTHSIASPRNLGWPYVGIPTSTTTRSPACESP